MQPEAPIPTPTPPVTPASVMVVLDQDSLEVVQALIAAWLTSSCLQVAVGLQLHSKGELDMGAARSMVETEFTYWRGQVVG